MLVALMPDTHVGSPLQGVPCVEGPAEDPCGQRCGRKAGGGRAGSRSGTSFSMGGAARRYWTSSPSRMSEGRCRLRKTQRVRHQNGSSGSAGAGFLFCLIILAFNLSRPWRRTFRLVPVCCPRDGGTLQAPLCPRPGLSQ